MPNHYKEDSDCPIEKHLVKTASKKSYKKHTPCNVECCIPEIELDCCSIPYQRLDKLRTQWSLLAVSGGSILSSASDGSTITNVYNRAGSEVTLPLTGAQVTPSIAIWPAGQTEISSYESGAVTPILNNAYLSYIFTNVERYLPFEACGKLDQVTGWVVDTSIGELELFQSIPELNLPISATRANLINTSEETLSSIERSQLKSLNVLYKASLKAIELIGGNPKTEGNIVTVTDKCGNHWLIAINSATNAKSICEVNTEFTFVGTILC